MTADEMRSENERLNAANEKLWDELRIAAPKRWVVLMSELRGWSSDPVADPVADPGPVDPACEFIPEPAVLAALDKVWGFDYGHLSTQEAYEQVEDAICAALEWMAEND